ncbi:MAG: DsbE family thiol:disulfide interchange protein [Pseudomonadota bacterium]
MAEARRIRWSVVIPPAIFVLLAVFLYAGLGRENPDALPSAFADQPAPDLALTELLPGQAPPDNALLAAEGVKLVNFWASWCAPCRVEHPILTGLADSGLPIIGVNYKDDPENARAFLQELGDPYIAVGADESGRNALDWGLYGVPETFVIDGDGRVVLRHAGPITGQVLTRSIRPAIEEAQARAGR